MVLTNYIIGIAKIIEEPEFKILDDDIYLTTCIVVLEESDNINLNFWGDLAYYVLEQYQVDDYILIEGYISSQESEISIDLIVSKQIIFTVLEVYLIYYGI